MLRKQNSKLLKKRPHQQASLNRQVNSPIALYATESDLNVEVTDEMLTTDDPIIR
jgi:hypothetical protein